MILCFFSQNSFALSPETKLADDVLESRAVNLFTQIRCIICNGQVIESSDTNFAKNMRGLVRERLESGKSDEEIKNELVKTFGDEILISPRKDYKIVLILAFALGISAIIFMKILSIRN